MSIRFKSGVIRYIQVTMRNKCTIPIPRWCDENISTHLSSWQIVLQWETKWVFFKYVISLLNFGRNYFRTSHLFLMFKNSSSQHQRKICVITTQLLDDKIRRKNPNLYKVHIFLHGRVWILSWLLCTIPYSFCIIIKKNLMVIILLGCVIEHIRICIR